MAIARRQIGLFWSGTLGQRTATLHAALLRLVFPEIGVFISTNIGLGNDRFRTIRQEIADTAVGVFFLTADSLESPWRPYECRQLAAAHGFRAIVPVRVGVSQQLADARASYLQPHNAGQFGSLFDFQALCFACASQLKDSRSASELRSAAETAWSLQEEQLAKLRGKSTAWYPIPTKVRSSTQPQSISRISICRTCSTSFKTSCSWSVSTTPSC